jgi:hypothetical protein
MRSSGKAHSVDAQPDAERGNILLTRSENGCEARLLGKAELVAARAEAGVPLRTSHFATCVKAGAFRRDQPKRPAGPTP